MRCSATLAMCVSTHNAVNACWGTTMLPMLFIRRFATSSLSFVRKRTGSTLFTWFQALFPKKPMKPGASIASARKAYFAAPYWYLILNLNVAEPTITCYWLTTSTKIAQHLLRYQRLKTRPHRQQKHAGSPSLNSVVHPSQVQIASGWLTKHEECSRLALITMKLLRVARRAHNWTASPMSNGGGALFSGKPARWELA